jgi:DNA-binding MurR/RpiR family transcriptional regulator
MDSTMRIRDLLKGRDLDLTRSERKIAQVLLAGYPVVGLSTIAVLAKRAGVSNPTVIRLVGKLGFRGYAAFQMQLLGEVEAGMRSPLMMMEAKRPASKGHRVAESYIRSAARAVEAAAGMTLPHNFERATELIMDARGSVLLLGGRFTRYVSGMLAAHLLQFRPNVLSLGPLSAESCDAMLDLSRRDTLVVFDHRRYQADVIRFAEQAARRHVQIVLFTDTWRSPIADKASVVIVSPVEVDSPYDTLAPAVAQVEALVAHIVARKSRTARGRVQELDRIRDENAVTVDTAHTSAANKDRNRAKSAS